MLDSACWAAFMCTRWLTVSDGVSSCVYHVCAERTQGAEHLGSCVACSASQFCFTIKPGCASGGATWTCCLRTLHVEVGLYHLQSFGESRTMTNAMA